MSDSKISLTILPGKLAVCRLDRNNKIPDWIEVDNFYSVTKTDEELSIVCSVNRVPDGIRAERDWRAFKVDGQLDFSLTGILASILNPLAEAGISIFAISTFDTDYLLVKSDKLNEAAKVLSRYFSINESSIE